MSPVPAFLRWGMAVLLGGGTALAMLWLMQWMVSGRGPGTPLAGERGGLELVRIKRDSETQHRKPKPPPPPPERQPPPMQPQQSPQTPAPAVSAPRIALPRPQSVMDFGTPYLGAVAPALPEQDVMPLSRIPPQYPFRASQQGMAVQEEGLKPFLLVGSGAKPRKGRAPVFRNGCLQKSAQISEGSSA